MKYYWKVLGKKYAFTWNSFIQKVQNGLDKCYIDYPKNVGIFPIKPDGSLYSYKEICELHRRISND